MHPVRLDTPSGLIGGYRADPHNEPRGGIVVVQEIFGVNRHIRSVVDRFAAHGFIAIAPCLFDHFGAGIELDYDEAGIANGRERVAELGFDRAVVDVEAAAKSLSGSVDKVGVVGYCWGGTIAFLANTRLGLPAASYYGGRTVPFLHERPRAPLMLHFGERDPLIPPEHIQAHRDALAGAHIHVYDAGHGFNCDQRADYDESAAQEAFQRTLRFFEKVLHP
ncbi:dienelactone hydrolase family protein [Xanthomonadaceae bacterium JHOS43]|nr:dienelactone hydrolase family protein [Xanthomonadaceae bacterium JHOS43]MCX7564006.1 dienelactone hydrolase family protein [Xanthomonadaceae bacterium XH05]